MVGTGRQEWNVRRKGTHDERATVSVVIHGPFVVRIPDKMRRLPITVRSSFGFPTRCAGYPGAAGARAWIDEALSR
jgi:hypothetical protein